MHARLQTRQEYGLHACDSTKQNQGLQRFPMLVQGQLGARAETWSLHRSQAEYGAYWSKPHRRYFSCFGVILRIGKGAQRFPKKAQAAE